MAVKFVTPVGRLVQGDLYTPNTTDRKGNPLVVKTGPNKGQPATQFYFALAIEKNNPDWPAFYQLLYNEARQGYPACFDAAGNIIHPRFTMKISDGDGVDADGKPNSAKEGFAGHWIVKFTSSYACKVVKDEMLEFTKDFAKCGHYGRVIGSASPNIGSDVPGLYVNPEVFEWYGYGKEIQGGINAVAAVQAAGRAAYVPAGMSTVPMGGAPAATATPPAPGTPPAAMAPPAPAAPAAMQPPAPPAPAPAAPPANPMQHQFIQGATATPPSPGTPPAPPAPAAPAAPRYVPTALGAAYPLEAWLAAGHTVDSLVASGHFTKA